MSRWSGRLPLRDRAQVEPLAALVAVFAVGVALTTYTGVLDATLPTPDRNLAGPTVERAERAVGDTGVADPEALPAGLHAGPDGYDLNLTLRSAGRTWHAGPTPPPSADAADLAVSVRVGPGRIRPGRLRAEVWS
ncbi:DUF7285 family protein [Halorussus salinisoli]|uniref:DUF7285 family protein n=1 Tax=Halorussus salinisoli TaxID=2558242 RepID=UPI0010C22291|nr:hypothetical protein [Halorussus salinisoli]